MLFVKTQMGLVKEGILFNRLAPSIRSCCLMPQSAYTRSVDDTFLLLREIVAETSHLKRALIQLHGDFKKTFPRQWRAALLNELFDVPQIRGGAYAELESILAQDDVHVWLSGISQILVSQGIPEGGCLGPLFYPLTPNSLMSALAEAGCGFGLGVQMPQAWIGYTWRGDGTPIDHWVESAKGGAPRRGGATTNANISVKSGSGGQLRPGP